MLYEELLEKVRSAFPRKSIVISEETNLRWLTGQTNTFSIILIKPKEQYIFTTDGFADLFSNLPYQIVSVDTSKKNAFLDALKKYASKPLMSDRKIKIRSNLAGKRILELRERKLPEELKLLARARAITTRAISKASKYIETGVSEQEIASHLECEMRRLGAERFAFDTIVASGERSFYTHILPSKKNIKYGDVVLIDAGATFKGYCADISRTFCCGENKDFDNFSNQLFRMNEEIISSIKPNIKFFKINEIYKKHLLKAKLKYLHLIGHGIGIESHEMPDAERRLSEGVVFTIEPGIYVHKKFGIRYEDMYTIKEGECICLQSLQNLL
jgi:Xaa-Pro aminopeptidase